MLLNICYSVGNFTLVCVLLYLVMVALIWVSTTANRLLVQSFGAKSQVRVGALGIVVHEISHMIVAILFGHEIVDYKLLDFKTSDESVTLGYVKDRWNNSNFFQRLGNFFEGIAPILFSSWLLLLVVWILSPDLIKNTDNFLYGFFYGIPVNVKWSVNLPFWKLLIIELFAIQLGFGGCSLSKADIEASKLGLKETLILLFVCFFSFEFVGWHSLNLLILTVIFEYFIFPIFLMLILMSLNLCCIKVLRVFREG